MATIQTTDFTVNRANLEIVQFVEKEQSEELSPNQVLLEIESFSFTSNNITYAVSGEKLSYWKFFPTEVGSGIIPAWGVAKVIRSTHADIRLGQQFYGYYPMSSHLLVTADRVSPFGFVDHAPHRQVLPPIYNFYTNTEQDPTFTSETKHLISIFRPLFITSFLIDDYLAEQKFYGATQILLTSASSKTAQALAALLSHRKKEGNLDFNLVGLTSEKNTAFVRQLGFYDQTMTYTEIPHLDPTKKFVVVDFTGAHDIQFQLQTLLADNLVYNCLVGLVDWQHIKGEKPLPKKGKFFFAPTHAERLQKEWGLSGFHKKVGIAWNRFIPTIEQTMVIKEFTGPEQLKELYLDMLAGKIDPQDGNIGSLKRQ